MPASRRARAITFAPRSCPSRPGLAMTPRIRCCDTLPAPAPGLPGARPAKRGQTDIDNLETDLRAPSLNYRNFVILAPGLAQNGTHFSDCGIRPNRIQQRRHRVFGALGHLGKGFERLLDGTGVPLRTDRGQPFELVLVRTVIDVQRIYAGPRRSHRSVHADDDALAALHGLLVAVG